MINQEQLLDSAIVLTEYKGKGVYTGTVFIEKNRMGDIAVTVEEVANLRPTRVTQRPVSHRNPRGKGHK